MLAALAAVAAAAASAGWLLWAAAALALLYAYGTWTHGHFRRRGVPEAPGALPFAGHMLPAATGRFSVPEFLLYLDSMRGSQPALGFYMFRTPVLLLGHPDYIKLVAIKDFDSFSDRQMFISEKLNPILGRGLFGLKGKEWREMRATLSPTFTSSKMRTIFKLINVCGDQTAAYIDQQITKSSNGMFETEMKEFFTRFTNDCIATAAFGIQVDSLKDPSNDFFRMGGQLTGTRGLRSLFFFGLLMCPKLMEVLNLSVIPESLVQYFHRIVLDTMKERKEKGIFRPDFLQLLIQAREGQLKVAKEDEHEAENIKADKRELTDADVTAQAVGFFFAGFETVSTLMGFSAVALARNPDVQQRLQREIDEVLDAKGDDFSYEAAQEMKYLDMVLNEVLRRYSGMGLNRVCATEGYTLPPTGDLPAITLRKGDIVWIAVHAIHHDPEYWPDPLKFDPERFSDANKANIKPFTYMPFGVGPRICIGNRLALLETKVVLVHLLRKFSFKAVERTPVEPTWAKPDFAIGLQRNCWLGIVPREA